MFSLVDVLNHKGKMWYNSNGWTGDIIIGAGGIFIGTGDIIIGTEGIIIGTGDIVIGTWNIVIGTGGIVIGTGDIIIRGGVGIGKSRVNVWWVNSCQRNGYRV